MISCQLSVDALIKFSVTRIASVECFVATVIFRQLLFYDVSFDRHAKVIGLAREISREMIIFIFLKSRIA